MKMALRAVAPPLLAGFVLGLFCGARPTITPTSCPSGFSFMDWDCWPWVPSPPGPSSPWAAGFWSVVCSLFSRGSGPWNGRAWHSAISFMAVTYGGLHLIYAVSVYSCSGTKPESMPNGA